MAHQPVWVRKRFFENYDSSGLVRASRNHWDSPWAACPCCGYPTLNERDGYEICCLCWWEDDGQDDNDADDIRKGPNRDCSLTEARQNFEEYLLMYPPESDTRISKDTPEEVGIKHKIVKALDELMEATSVEQKNELWAVAGRGRKDLYRILKGKLRAAGSRS